MNPNSAQAIQREDSGIEEEEEDVDYDALYGGLDVDSSPEKSPEIKNDYKKIFGDVAKQGIKETLIGAGGTWGDLAELAGLNKQNPSQEVKNTRDFSTLEKFQDPEYQPSFSDLYSLSDDEDIGAPSSKLPTSQSLGELNDALGGPGEAETTPGKFAGRAGKLYGAGLAFGQVNPTPAIAAGVAGQGVEEAKGGPLLQAAAEIAAMLVTQGRSGKNLVSSTKKQVQDKINDLRKLGYTEEDITLAINSESKKRVKMASKGKKTEEAFENFAEHSDQMVSDILSSEIPGIEQGTKHVHQMASDAYGQVAQQASNLTITNSKPFLDASKRVVDQLQKTLGSNPEAHSFIQRISDAAIHSTQYPTADSFMNFYKELNSMGNWLGRSQKDRLISQVKDGIKETFRSEGKAGRDLANKFEEVNAGVRKAFQAEEVHNLIQKTATQNGIDYKKMNKLFDKPENVHLMEDVLGVSQTNNLRMISKTGKEIGNFDKAWKAVNNFKVGTAADVARGTVGSYYLYQGDWEGLAKVAASKIGTTAIKKLAEKSLTDPKFQNLLIKGMHSIKNASPKAFVSANEAMKKYLVEEGIDIDLD